MRGCVGGNEADVIPAFMEISDSRGERGDARKHTCTWRKCCEGIRGSVIENSPL